jgi:hypothetical protein
MTDCCELWLETDVCIQRAEAPDYDCGLLILVLLGLIAYSQYIGL